MANFHYRIEIRDKSDNLKEYAQNDVKSVRWRYDSIGGCGDCEIVFNREFDNYGDIDLDYDVRVVRLPDPHGSPGAQLPALFTASGIQLGTGFANATELRWRGFVREIVPSLDEHETVTLRCSGYIRQLEYIIVPDQTFLSADVGAIARSIVDSWVVPGSRVQRTGALSLMQDTGISVSSAGLRFDTSAYEALKTLAEIGGNAEWGVKAEDNEIYFQPRSATVKQTFVVGDRIRYYQPSRSTDELVNWVYLRGALGNTYILTNGPYMTDYQKERVVFVPSVQSSADATLWGASYFSRFGTVQPKGRLTVGATDAWVENVSGETMPPLGRLRVLGGRRPTQTASDPLPSQLPFRLFGTVGGITDTQFRVASIDYTPTENGLDISIDLGEKRGALTDHFRAIDFKLSDLRQGVRTGSGALIKTQQLDGAVNGVNKTFTIPVEYSALIAIRVNSYPLVQVVSSPVGPQYTITGSGLGATVTLGYAPVSDAITTDVVDMQYQT